MSAPADIPVKKPRKPNPRCARRGCSHPQTFHPRDKVKHRSKCTAFGCKCSGYQKPVGE